MTSYDMDRATLPDGEPLTTHDVQAVWQHYVKPTQDAGEPQSGEMRVLMGILRACWSAYTDAPGDAEQLSLPTPTVAPLGWEVNDRQLVSECWGTFVTTDPGHLADPEDKPRHQLALAALLQNVGAALPDGGAR